MLRARLQSTPNHGLSLSFFREKCGGNVDCAAVSNILDISDVILFMVSLVSGSTRRLFNVAVLILFENFTFASLFHVLECRVHFWTRFAGRFSHFTG